MTVCVATVGSELFVSEWKGGAFAGSRVEVKRTPVSQLVNYFVGKFGENCLVLKDTDDEVSVIVHDTETDVRVGVNAVPKTVYVAAE